MLKDLQELKKASSLIVAPDIEKIIDSKKLEESFKNIIDIKQRNQYISHIHQKLLIK